MKKIIKLPANHMSVVIVASSVLVACGGGGGGGNRSSTDSRSINEQNQTQIVAAVMGQLAATDAVEQVSGTDTASSALITRARDAVVKVRAGRAVQEVPGFCSSGRVLVDDETGSQVYEQCLIPVPGEEALTLNGSVTVQDFSEVPDALHDFVNGYDISLITQFSNGDRINVDIEGSSLINLTENGERAETQMEFATDYTCNAQNGDFVGAYDIVSDVTVAGAESTYVENGQMRFTGGSWVFVGEVTITTTEPLRYREGYNEDFPYEGTYRITASDGSGVTLSFTEGGMYVGEQFYTWAEFDEQVVVDDVYANCGRE